MARPTKKGIDFPVWNPQPGTRRRFFNRDFKARYKAMRNSSSSFIKRDDVRSVIKSDYNGVCFYCYRKHDLQIDHIISVYECAMGRLPVEDLNTRSNLRLLCRSCNSSKSPLS